MKYIIYISVLLITISSYCQDNKFIPELKVILSMDYGQEMINQCSRFSVKNAQSFFNISENEISNLEANFKKIYKLKSTNCCIKGSKISDLKFYGYQYLGVIINDEKYIYINAFDIEASKVFLDPNDWKTKSFIVCDGGESFWGALYNIKKKKFKHLSMNGQI